MIMPSMPLVSVVIPTRDYATFLPGAIESVARQNHARKEVVVVDDGSTDDSVAVARELERSYRGAFETFCVIALPETGGKLHAVNRGMRCVRGEISVVLDADDRLEPDYLAITVSELEDRRATDIAFVYTDCFLVDAEGEVLGIGRARDFDEERLEVSSYIPACAAARTETVRNALPFDERVRIGTNHHRWRRIARAGWRGVRLAEPLFRYTLHERNLSGIGSKLRGTVRGGESCLATHWPVATRQSEGDGDTRDCPSQA
jgi:glycosyltransferase involved in cell wall biosynthesis